jgi:hypothetical protein
LRLAAVVFFRRLLVQYNLPQHASIKEIENEPTRRKPEVVRLENLHHFVKNGWLREAQCLFGFDPVTCQSVCNVMFADQG